MNTNSTDTLAGHTTRPATFSVVNRRTREVEEIRTFPAGTEVTCRERGGLLVARVTGTLFTQDLYFSAVRPA